jgi:hypothetical protein
MNPKFKKSLRKALATFIFSTVGMLLGVNILDVDMSTWKLVLSTGAGSLLNLLFRWAEAVVKEDTV